MTPRRLGLILVASLAVVYLGIVFTSPRDAFWTIDGGFKFLAVEQMVASCLGDVSLPYPGQTIDEAGEFFPIKPPMATKVRGRFYPDVSLVFPVLSTPFYQTFSWFGLYLLPLLGTLILLWLAYRLVEPEAGAWSPISIPLLGLATPLFFYAVTFWEHSLAVLHTTAAVLLLAGTGGRVSFRTGVYAGLLLGMAIWFREECYVFAGSAALALLLTRAGLRAALGSLTGSAAAVVPLLLFQWRVLGRPLGKRIQGATEYGLFRTVSGEGTGYFGDRLETLYAWTLGLDQDLGRTLAVSVPLLAGLALFLILGRRRNLLVLPWAGAAVYAVLCLLVLGGLEERIFSTYFAGGLFSTAPVLAVLLSGAVAASGRRPWHENFMAALILVFFSAAVILSPIKYQRGVHWGPRYLLPILPLLTALGLGGIHRATRTLTRRAPLFALGIFVLGLSFVIQTHGIMSLEAKKNGTARTISLLRDDARADVVTNVWWFPLEVAPAFRERRMYQVTGTADFHALLGRFEESGIDRFTLVITPDMKRILNDPALSLQRIHPHLNPAMGYFDLLFCDCAVPKRNKEDSPRAGPPR